MFDLRALQLQVESDGSVESYRETLTKAVEFFSTRPDNELSVTAIFDQLREHLDFSTIEDKGIFFFDPDEIKPIDVPSEYKSYPLGLFSDDRHSPYAGRLVYPVRDVKGKVMGLCGWDAEVLPKYLDSHTYGYHAKNNSLYGMEKLPEYYRSNKPVFVVEGIVCCIYLRSKGYNALALLGSSVSKYVIEILKRFGDRCILLPDNDEAGLFVLKSARYKLPKARCYVSKVAKDIDDTRKVAEEALLRDLDSLSTPFAFTSVLAVQK